VCDAVLADGGTVHIRPIGPHDARELVAFHSRLSDESIYLRFFSFHPTLSAAEVERFTNVDQDQRMALVATLRGRIVGVARYDRVPEGSDEAEAAFVVDDAHQGRGLGTLLLEHLAAFARTRGVRRFLADTLPQNRPMQEVFRRAGFVEESHFDNGVVRVRLDIQPTEATVDAIEARWCRAAANSIRRLLAPRSVAVIGAGLVGGAVGNEILGNILAAGFTGRVYAVDPEGCSVPGVQAYPGILAIADEIDLAVVAVPAGGLRETLHDCAAKDLKGVVVVTPGSRESAPDVAAYNRELAELTRGSGMRMIGPGSLGIINTDPEVRLDAGVVAAPPAGRIAFSTQSDPVGLSVLEEFGRRRLGLSSFVSLGEKADVSGNDLLHYWQQDDNTDVILLYLESFGNPRRFARVAREVSAAKPIVAVKTVRGVAGEDSAVDAVFSRSGVVRVGTFEELLDVAEVLAEQPTPAGRRVAIVTGSEGSGKLASDACLAAGLVLAELSPATGEALRGIVPDASGRPRNPVEIDLAEGPPALGRALEAVLADVGVDAVLTVLSPPAPGGDGALPPVAEAAAAGSTKPVVANLLAVPESPQAVRVPGRTVPCFPIAERAARALAAACRYGEWRAAPRGEVVALEGVDPDAARALVASAVDPGGSVTAVDDERSVALLAAYGIPVSAEPLRDAVAEASVGVVNDPSFGPLVSLAIGSPAPSLLDPPARAVVPLTDVDAAALVRRAPGSALLLGPYGAPTAAAGALEAILLRVAQMAHDLHDLSEARLDPVTVGSDRVSVRSVSVLVAPAAYEDPTLRRLG
jgi:acyl-CoA synthetase (NDP forming)/RimJ/RimL family protein N-acetyltransferase